MDILNILLFSPPAEGQESGGLLSFLPLVLIMVVFYFFFIRPQMKKAKDQRVFREALKKGDKVITIGGIHGKIAEVKETTVLLDVEGGNKLLLEKSAIISDSAQVGLAK
ncbi:MAG: preprotein translocase subunit YajC [Bacteroidales bacterium]|nr:preprotein translocase subunit YajC [Bacteroidales bacterium]MDP2236171.1 preprotein translocase subunit YajC [Bacteroidales bacterium]